MALGSRDGRIQRDKGTKRLETGEKKRIPATVLAKRSSFSFIIIIIIFFFFLVFFFKEQPAGPNNGTIPAKVTDPGQTEDETTTATHGQH